MHDLNFGLAKRTGDAVDAAAQAEGLNSHQTELLRAFFERRFGAGSSKLQSYSYLREWARRLFNSPDPVGQADTQSLKVLRGLGF